MNPQAWKPMQMTLPLEPLTSARTRTVEHVGPRVEEEHTGGHFQPGSEVSSQGWPRSSLDCLLDLPDDELGPRLEALDWDFADQPSGVLTHGIHPYPAKFAPSLARQAILLLSRPGDMVLDPFLGGGTTAVEALAAGRACVGIDANPVGVAVARAKTSRFTKLDSVALQHLEADLMAFQRDDFDQFSEGWLPSIPNVEKWYDPDIFRALGLIRGSVLAVERDGARAVAMVAFIQAASRLSFQDSETRYSSKPRSMDVLEAPRAVMRELRKVRKLVEVGSVQQQCHAVIAEGDARDSASFPTQSGAAGLVVTSPPYPNAYDYHLYHRFRLFWLGRDPAGLRRIEIGSHLKNQTRSTPTVDYLADMRLVMENCSDALMPGRYAVVVVGDGLFKGELFDTSGHLRAIASEVGFEYVTTFERHLPANRRSVTRAGRRLAVEDILVLRKPRVRLRGAVIGPNYRLAPYERELQIRELDALGGSPAVSPNGDLTAMPSEIVRRAAFTHGFRVSDRVVRTYQYNAEGAPAASSRKKNSTYFTHALHRYKGKFYPQLAKCLINLSAVTPGKSLVVDPFGGSGTVALESVLSGVDVVSVDCNPVAVATARAKVRAASLVPEVALAELARLRTAVQLLDLSGDDTLDEFAPETLPELERWLPNAVLRKLNCVLRTVRGAAPGIDGLCEVLVSDIIRDVSQQEPRDLRIRRRAVPIDDAPVYGLFLSRLERLEQRMARYWQQAANSPHLLGSGVIVLGDSAEPGTLSAQLGPRRIDAVVSSPPYASALPYIDTDRLSLAAVFGCARSSRRSLEQTMIGSRDISERERRSFEALLADESLGLPVSTRQFLLRYRTAVAADRDAGFRKKQAPAVLLRYFLAMNAVLANLRGLMTADAPCWLVLGDSRSKVGGRAWTIPTTNEVAAAAEFQGFRIAGRTAITVTREDAVHSRNAITNNEILELRA